MPSKTRSSPSWDANRLLIRTTGGDLRIVPHSDLGFPELGVADHPELGHYLDRAVRVGRTTRATEMARESSSLRLPGTDDVRVLTRLGIEGG
jgi:hypothetical protein